MLPRLTIVIVAFVLAAAADAQTTITLRSSARLADGAQQVRLGDIAEVTGIDAESLIELSVIDQPTPGREGWIRVDMGQVRSALESHPNINWGKLTLRGSRCKVRLAEPVAPGGDGASPSTPKGRDRQPVPIDLSGPATVRTAVATRLAGAYGVSADRVRLGFDPADTEVLDALVAGRTVDVDLGASPGSARVPVKVSVYSGDSLAISHNVQVDVLVSRPVVTAAADVERGRTIQASDISVVEQWVVPGLSSPLIPAEAIGSVAQNRISSGQSIDRDDVAPPLACKRGDTVYVHCLSGSIIVKVKARAMGQARDGEMVQLKAEGSDEPFSARMSGRGRAVLVSHGGDPGQSVFASTAEKPAAKPSPINRRKDKS